MSDYFEMAENLRRGKMSKAQLIYDLPQESEAFHDALNGGGYRSILQDFDTWLRGKVKYESENFTDAECKLFELIRDKLHTCAVDEELEIW